MSFHETFETLLSGLANLPVWFGVLLGLSLVANLLRLIGWLGWVMAAEQEGMEPDGA